MDAFYFCWEALVKECDKHKVYLWITAPTILKVHNDVSLPIHRIVYVYLRGTYIINLLQDCMFRSINSQTLPLYYQLAAKDICNICCLSTGPGIETVGFLSAFRKHVYDFKSVSVSVISNSSEWRDFSEALICVNRYHPSNATFDFYSPNIFEFIPCNPRDLSPEKNDLVRQSVLKADVIIMHRYYSSCELQSFTNMVQEITSLMKKDALLFFLHSKSKQTVFQYLKDKGTCLIPTMKIKVENIPYDLSLSSIVGVPPKTKGSSQFTLWKKESSRGREIVFKPNFQNESLDSSIFPDHSSLSNLINLSQPKMDINSLNVCSSKELLSLPKSNSESLESALYEVKSSDLKEHIPQTKSNKELKVTTLHEVQSSNIKDHTPQPQSIREIVENTLYGEHHSDFNDNSCSRVSKTSLETSRHIVKSLECNDLPNLDAATCNVHSDNSLNRDKERERELEHDSSECEQSKIIAMIDHCEKMVTNLEEKLQGLAVQLHSSKNLCNNFCACYRNHICHHSCLASHQKCAFHSFWEENCCHNIHCHDL